ncbi:alpha/beta hydrolase [Marinobacter halodurans]|uniref:Alpha/beta hydrolase n=1 Tax=Marinobacter halodurans TaxID=2528979 RepID=A0ABY1ZN74_9GAMM|nr:alpha/beta hydrolase [Marinobacter halodurans]TBW54876.1 alpha/beta hydrolase [Marinobacter halodurans]
MERVVSLDVAADGHHSDISVHRWQQAGKWFAYGEHAIFSRIDGRGDALLLLHGFPTASWDWNRIWSYLTPSHQVLVADMLGFGFSDKPVDYPYSLIDQADLQQGWLEAMGIRRVHLLAHDYGCSVAQELLAREQEGSLPFSIASACFLNGALFPEVHQPILIQKLLVGPLGGLVSRGLTRGVFDHNFSKLFGHQTRPSRSELNSFWQLLVYNNGRGILHRLIRYMDERRCHRNRWVGALQNAPQPLRLISGTADPVSGIAMADRYRQLIPLPDVIALDGIGHYPHYENPVQVFEAVRDFHTRV